MIAIKNGMQMMLEQFLGPELIKAIEAAKTDIPVFAKKLDERFAAMENTLARIEAKLNAIEVLAEPSSTPEFTMEQLTDGRDSNNDAGSVNGPAN